MADPSAATIAASPNCFLGYSPFVAYAEFPALGIHRVEIPAPPGGSAAFFAPELMDAADLDRLRDRLQQLQLTAISVGAYCDLLNSRHVDLLKRRIDFARDLGASNVVSDATRQLEVDQEQWRRLVNALRYLGDYAADRGVKIALETHGGITRNGALAGRLLAAVDHLAVGVNYDTGNIYYYNENLDPAEDVRQVADKVFQVHLKDTSGGKGEWMFCPLGDGRVDFPAVLGTLKASGFSGPYSLELEGRRGEDLNRAGHRVVIVKSLGYLRTIGLIDPGTPGAGSIDIPS